MENAFNIVSYAFSQYIKREREGLGLSSRQLAKELRVSPSYVRLLESCQTDFTPNKSFLLIKIFPKIRVNRICKLLIAVQELKRDTSKENKSTWTEMQLRMEKTGNYDDKLDSLFKEFNSFWMLKPQDGLSIKKAKDFLTGSIIQTPLKSYLEDESFGKTKEVNEIQQHHSLSRFESKILKLPSFHIPRISNQLDDLSYTNVNLLKEDSKRWIESNSARFQFLRVVWSGFNDLIDPQTLENYFDYHYLWNESLIKIECIILNSSKNGQKLRNEFSKSLHKLYSKNNTKYAAQLDNFSIGLDKVYIRSGASQESLIKKNFQNNIWIFTLHDEYIHVGFAGQDLGKSNQGNVSPIYIGQSLNYLNTLEKVDAFDMIWNELE